MNLIINRVKPDHPGFIELIELLDHELWERNHGRQADYVAFNMLAPETRVVTITDGETPIASGAFRNFGNGTAEIKRMFVRKEFRGKGFGKQVIAELETWAKEEGLTKSILETGLDLPEAVSLYKKSGYQVIGNYGPYKNMPMSVCMGKVL